MLDDEYQLAELQRRLANLVRLGSIEQLDHAQHRLRVRTGDLLTTWLPWPAELGRNFIRWRPLRVGQQVIMVAPSGDLAQAQVVGRLYTQALDAPSDDPALDVIAFDDGTQVQYDSDAHHLAISVAGSASIATLGTLTLSASQLLISGPVTQVGGDIDSDGISLQHHTHGGVTPGAGSTGEPQ